MLIKIIAFLFFVFFSFTSVSAQLKGITSYDNAYRSFMSGDFEKAIRYYNEYLQSYPSDSKAYDERGRCFENLHRYDNAIKDYSTAISLSPSTGLFYNDRGYAYLKSGLTENSVSDFTQSINVNPNSPDGYEGRVQAYLDLGKNEPALSDINKALLFSPDNPMYLVTRASIYTVLDDTVKMYSDMEKILRYYPGSFFTSYKSQIAVLQLDNFTTRIHNLTVLISETPENRILYFKRGFNYYLLKKFDAAINDFEKCISISVAEDKLVYFSSMFIDNSKIYKD